MKKNKKEKWNKDEKRRKRQKNDKKPYKNKQKCQKSQQQCETAKQTTEKCRKKVKNIKKHWRKFWKNYLFVVSNIFQCFLRLLKILKWNLWEGKRTKRNAADDILATKRSTFGRHPYGGKCTEKRKERWYTKIEHCSIFVYCDTLILSNLFFINYPVPMGWRYTSDPLHHWN